MSSSGKVAGDLTEILSGLESGQRVVTSAQFLLDSESNLGEVMKSMIGNVGSGDKAMQAMPGMDKHSKRKKKTHSTKPCSSESSSGRSTTSSSCF